MPLTSGLILAMIAGLLAPPAAAQGGAQVGKWKTFVLSSGSEIAVPAPPADSSDQTKAELAELRALQTLRSPLLNAASRFWTAVPATLRWSDLTQTLSGRYGIPGPYQPRPHAIVATAMFDAVVAAYNAKYQHNRRPPSAVASDLVADVVGSDEPSYPSEHAAMAAAAAATLAYLFPQEAKSLAAMAEEAGQARLVAGANYRSDITAGLALGAAVAQKAIERAQSDNFSTPWTGTAPTGPGIWIVPQGLAQPVGVTAASWKPYLLTSASQFRPGPPPAFGSAEFKAALAELKRINQSVTPTERQVAVWWGTMSGGVWARVAHDLMARDGLGAAQSARVLAFLNAANWDVSIAGLEAKYAYWLIRPYQADPTIVPLIPQPGHPSYPAGAGFNWGLSAEMIAHFFPQDEARIRYMQTEALTSRLFAGIHYRFDIDSGLAIARQVAALYAERDRQDRN
jgi:membrane-associated phospholipid phosphatase